MTGKKDWYFVPYYFHFKKYKNLANIGTGKYRPDSIRVLSLNDDNTAKEEIPYEIEDDILIVKEQGNCALFIEAECECIIQINKANDFNMKKDYRIFDIFGGKND